MPIYEYRCDSCEKRSSLLLRSLTEAIRPVCPYCGGKQLKRLFSRFAMVQSEEERMERLADPSRWGGLDENDPKSMIQWAKRMGREMGEDVGEDFDQMVGEEFEKESSGSDDTPDED